MQYCTDTLTTDNGIIQSTFLVVSVVIEIDTKVTKINNLHVDYFTVE